MGWRWYGEGNDPITLNDIKQIPGVTSIVWALHSKMPGEIWEESEYVLERNNIVERKNTTDNTGLHMGIWWTFLLISVWLMNIILFLTFFKEGAL